MKVVGIYIQDSETLEYNRVDLFDDEKISVTSSIQNINDIAKTYTDFSNTYTVPATKQNNKIFKHWYENSNDYPFSTLTKSNAYIEIDTIPFRKGKIQLESANVIDGKPQDYSITFIGILGNLKDTFAGLYLKDLTDTTYDFVYSANNVISTVVDQGPSKNIMFPLITSQRIWNYGKGGNDDISLASSPIRYNELFPSIKIYCLFDMIQKQFNINFNGIFLNNLKFQNAYLWLKNSETFSLKECFLKVDFNNVQNCEDTGYTIDLNANTITSTTVPQTFVNNGLTYTFNQKKFNFYIAPTVSGKNYNVYVYKNGNKIFKSQTYLSVASQYITIDSIDLSTQSIGNNDIFEIYIGCTEQFSFQTYIVSKADYFTPSILSGIYRYCTTNSLVQTLYFKFQIYQYMPEIKIEDFFTGILKMFNLTCYSIDGINYTIEQLENYYGSGLEVDITKYVIQDKKNLNRVKTYKKIKFDYEKSDSIINVGFNSTNGIEYGSLYYSSNPPADGEEYGIKLPFEDLNFSNLKDKLQVGYAVKTDLKSYIPKAIILYNYFDRGTTDLQNTTFYMSNSLTTNGTGYNSYRPFGQETTIFNNIYSLNFNSQQSTLTNDIIQNGLYQTYYSNYFANIFNYKARLIKLNSILPTSVLTSLKLNDSIIIRDTKYIINTMTTDLTAGEVQFELLTEQRKRTTDVIIGSQTWMGFNLNVSVYNDGSVIPQALNFTDWTYYNNNGIGAWSYYKCDASNDKEYGKLYNGYAVNDTRGLYIQGYHIPTNDEWLTLKNTLTYGSGDIKETGFIYWDSPNTNATNATNFSARGAGIIQNNNFYSIKSRTIWWTKTVTGAALRTFYVSFNDSKIESSSNFLMDALSIRLIKD